MNDSQEITSLGENAYAICGKMFYFEPHVFDLSDAKQKLSLIAFAEQLYGPENFLKTDTATIRCVS